MKKYLLSLFLLLSVSIFCSKAAVNLTITGGSVPTSMAVGQSYSITINVRNTGTTPTAQNFIINISVNSANTYNGGQTWIKDISVTGGIPAGTTRSYTTTIALGLNYPNGSKYILAGADGLNVVSESSESDNNYAFNTLVYTLPELYPSPNGLSLSAGPYISGSSLTTSLSVSNGGGNAGAFNVGFYLSNSSNLILSQSILLGTYSYSGMPGYFSGATNYKVLSIPSYVCSGNYYLFMFVDNGYAISESVENNNFKSIPISITNLVSNSNPSTISPGSTSSTNPTTISNGAMSWNAVSGAGNYNIFIRDVTTGTLYSYNCGSSTTSFTIPSSILITGHSYRWNMSASTSCGSCESNYSGLRYFIYNPCAPVSISSSGQPVSTSACVGINERISVTATNATSYQWRKNGVNLSNGTKYSGVQTSQLTINSITTSDAGAYSCFVTGCNNSVISNAAQLTVIPYSSPNANFEASNNFNDIRAGQSVYFNTTNACLGCTYQWNFVGGTPSTSTSAVPIVRYNVAGTYNVSLTLTNSCGLSSYEPISGFITVKPNTSPSTQVPPNSTIVNMNGYPIEFAADPVKIPTLDYGYNKSLLSMKTIGGGLEFKVYYNSNLDDYVSNLGTNWSHNFDFKVQNEGDTIWRVFYGEGYNIPFIRYYNQRDKSFPLYAGIFDNLTKDTTANTFTLETKYGIKYHFNSSGKLDYIKDRNNNVTDLDYAANGNLIKITGAGGRYWTLTNSNNKIASITDLENNVVRFNYDGTDITGIVDPDNFTTRFQYDGNHLMTHVVNPKGNLLLQNVYVNGKVTTQYDVNNKATYFYQNTPSTGFTKVVFPDGTFKTYQSDDKYRIIDEEDEEGRHLKHYYYFDNTDSVIIDKRSNMVSFDKDTIGNITAVHKPLGINEYIEYGKYSLVTKKIDAENNITQFERDSFGNNIRIITPTQSIQNSFDTKGQLLTVQNSLFTTKYFWNSLGDNYSIETPTGTTDLLHDDIGREIEITNENRNTSTKTYNGRSLVTAFKDFDQKTITFEYDENENKTKSIDKKSIPTFYIFDNKDRDIAIVNVRGDTIERKYFNDRDFVTGIKGANQAITYFENDKTGQVVKITNPLNATTTITRDANDNPTTTIDVVNNLSTSKVFDALNRNTSTTIGDFNTKIKYNKNSVIDQLTNERGLLTKFTINSLGKITNVNDPKNNNTVVGYNQFGSPTTVRDANNHTVTTEYDYANRPYKYIDALGSIDEKELDPLGNVKRYTKGNGVFINATYTPTNKIKTIEYSTGESYTYNYDDNDNVLTVAGTGGTMSFEYDDLNRPTKYKDYFNNVLLYEYDKASNITKITYQSGKAVTFQYNALNLLTDVIDWKSGNYHYDYNTAGRLLKLTYPNGMNCNYSYDANGLVKSKIWKKQNGSVIYGDSISRNNWGDVSSIACGNCYQKILQTKNYGATYDDADQIIKDSLARHYFDKSGNDTLIKNDSSQYSYRYTRDNILASITGNNLQYQFQYDALGNRIQQTINGSNTRYINNTGVGLSNVLMEQGSDELIKAYNIFGSGLLARIDSSGKIYYYITDIKHNVVALVNDSAIVTDRYIYDDFGKVWKHTGSTQQPYTWLGEMGVQSVNDSLYYVRARYYNTTTGRFINRDPYQYDLTKPQTVNRYVYSLNNAINMFDWTGLYGNKDGGTNKQKTLWRNIAHTVLDIAGLFPGYGEPADLLNAALYAEEGDFLNSSLSAGSAVPVAGWAATFGKWFKKVDNISNLASSEIKLYNNLNSTNAISNFGIYKIEIDGELYKYGKADLNRITQSSGLPTRLHQQVRNLSNKNPNSDVFGQIIQNLGMTTTKNAKSIEFGFINDYYNNTNVIPTGNAKSFFPK